MPTTLGYAAQNADTPLAPYRFTRREPGEHDVEIAITHCGVCHSDVHQVRNEWGGSIYPMVPGHEIVGRVTRVGAKVRNFKVGDLAGVGCMVDSCRTCVSCKQHEEQYCEVGFVGTYNSRERDTKAPTYGGYADAIVVNEDFTLKVSPKLDLARVAPLLCAGITTYSPLRHWNVRKGQSVGVIGLGGLGHMAVKFARAFGAHVVVFTTSPGKVEDALHLGAHEAVVSKNPEALAQRANTLDFILDTVSAAHDLTPYLQMLKLNGSLVMVGIPTKAPEVAPFHLIHNRRQLGGSLIGGIKETQEMLDFCAEHDIMSDVEVIAMEQVNGAYERMLRSDVKYRFVIDMATLKG